MRRILEGARLGLPYLAEATPPLYVWGFFYEALVSMQAYSPCEYLLVGASDADLTAYDFSTPQGSI